MTIGIFFKSDIMFPFKYAMHATGSVGSVVPPGSFIGSYDSHRISFFSSRRHRR